MSLKLVVCDASPLIILARTRQLELLSQLFEGVFLTDTVQEECLVDLSLPGAQAIDQAIREHLLHVARPLRNPVLEESLTSLDAGEKTAILLALERGATLLIDEKRGRHVAQNLSIRILGTAGLLLRAYDKGLIPDIQLCLKDMKNHGYRLSDRLQQAVLKHASELSLQKKTK